MTITANGQNSGLTDSATDSTQIGYPPVPDPVLDGKKDPAYTLIPMRNTSGLLRCQWRCSGPSDVDLSIWPTPIMSG